MSLTFHTTSITERDFKDKHGGWAISFYSKSLTTFEVLTRQFDKAIRANYPHLSVKALHREDDYIWFILYGASQLDFERMTTRTHESIAMLSNGYKIFNFAKLSGSKLARLDKKLSPPPYTETIEPEVTNEPAWNEIEEARKQIDEARKQLEEEKKALENEKIKLRMTAKMMMFDEEVAKFKSQFFTQDELTCIRKMIDERF